MSKRTKITLATLLIVLLIALGPLFALRGAEFGGSDDAGSRKVEEILGESYEPWFAPVLEQMLGGELPGEVESLFFCLQTRHWGKRLGVWIWISCSKEKISGRGTLNQVRHLPRLGRI